MTPESILSFLKFGGPIVGLASAVWSTTQKITQEGANGVKRLTLQGRVLIGIIALSTLISILALGFETVIGRQTAAEKKEAEKEKRENDRMLVAEKRQARDDAAARDQVAVLARLEADSAEQKRFLEQGLLISSKATEQQRRDARISLQVTKEANARLAEAERTFAEFARINYPLREITADVTLSFDFGRNAMPDFWKEIEARVVKKRQDYAAHWQSLPESRRGTLDPGGSMIIPFDPAYFRDVPLRQAIAGTTVRLEFVAPEDAPNEPMGIKLDEITLMKKGAVGPTIIPLALKFESAEALFPERIIQISFSGRTEPKPDELREIGDKFSVPDVKKFMPILAVTHLAAPYRLKRLKTNISWVGFYFNGSRRFGGSSEIKIANSGKSLFILRPGSAR